MGENMSLKKHLFFVFLSKKTQAEPRTRRVCLRLCKICIVILYLKNQ